MGTTAPSTSAANATEESVPCRSRTCLNGLILTSHRYPAISMISSRHYRAVKPMKSPELAQIADILPPPVPIVSPGYTSLIIALLLLLIAAIIWSRYTRSSTRHFHRLRRQYQQKRIDNRLLAFRLTRLLCHRYDLPRFSPSLAPQSLDNTDWQHLADKLQAACFSREGMNDESLAELLDKVSQWLQKSP